MGAARTGLERAARRALAADPSFQPIEIRWLTDEQDYLRLRIDLRTPDGRPAHLELIERRDPNETPWAPGAPTRYWYALHSENARGERLYQGLHRHRELGGGVPIAHRSERVEGQRARWEPDTPRDPETAIAVLLANYLARHTLRPAPAVARRDDETMRAYRRRKLAAMRLAAA